MKEKKQRVTWSLILTMVICLFAVFPEPAAAVEYQTLGSMAVGSTVKLNVAGVSTDFIVVNQGFGDGRYIGFDGGTILLMKNIYTEMQWNTYNDARYEYSNINSYLNNTFKSFLDEDIQSSLKTVKIPYTYGRPDGANNLSLRDGTQGLSTQIYLPSATELGFNSDWSRGYDWFDEGNRWSYFPSNQAYGLNDLSIAHRNDGTAVNWWLRSAYGSANGYSKQEAYYITSNGTVNCNFVAYNILGQFDSATGTYPTVSYGIRPALVLPNTLLITPTGYATSSTPPTAPISISTPAAIYGGTPFLISWAAGTDIDGNLAGYSVERSTDGSPWNQIYQGGALSTTDTVPVGTNSVVYRVKAYDSKGLESDYTTGVNTSVINTANYTTNYYQQNALDDGYTLVESPTVQGTINSTVAAAEKSYAGFHENTTHSNRVIAGTVAYDGSLVLSRYYDRDTFTAAFNSNGGSAVANIAGIRYGSTVPTPNAPAKKGYDFGKWYSDKGLSTAYNFAAPVTANIILYAGWTPRNDTPYIVEHYQQNANDNGYTLKVTEYLIGTTDATATAQEKTYTSFHLNSLIPSAVPSASISPEGNTVLKLYYDRNINAVTYSYANETDVTPPAPPETTNYRYGQTVSVDAGVPVLAGYDFSGWETADAVVTDGQFTMPDALVAFTGAWTPRSDTPFTVEYYLQNVSDDAYTLADTVNGKGVTGETVPHKEFEGYTETPDSVTAEGSFKIKSDGTAILKLYFDRAICSVTYAYAGETDATPPALPETANYRYGQTVSVDAGVPVLPGYDFSGWKSADVEVTDGQFSMPDKPVTFTGTWKARSDVPYTVEFYQQNIEDDGYTLADTFNGEGTAGGNIPLKEFEGFLLTPDSVTAAGNFKIRSDGTATLKLYYDRERFTVTYSYAGRTAGDTVPEDAPELPATASYRYGQTVALPAQPQSKSTLCFLGWALDGTLTNLLNFELEKDAAVTGYWYTPASSGEGGDNDKAAYSAVLIPDSAVTDIVLRGDSSNRVTFLEPPEKNGCTFAGWATESGGDATYHAGDTITLTRNCVFYAVYYRQIAPYIIGFTDNTFRPCSNLTLKQGALMLNRLGVSTQITSSNLYFTRRVFLSLICTATGADIRSQDPVALAVEKRWIIGFTDGTLRPDDYITRAQAATILDRVFRQGEAQVKDGKSFADIPQTHWANDAISRASATSTIRV